MDGKRRILQHIALACVLLLLVGTLLSYFIIPRISDAKTRRALALDDGAFVTDTARSPWIYINEEGGVTVYGDRTVGMKTLVFPRAVNGIKVEKLEFVIVKSSRIETVVIPKGLQAKNFLNWRLRDLTSLKTLILEEGVDDLTGCSAGSLPTLTAVYLPRSLTKIPSNLLKDDATATLYYAGTEEEWRALGDAAGKLLKKHTVVFETPVPTVEE